MSDDRMTTLAYEIALVIGTPVEVAFVGKQWIKTTVRAVRVTRRGACFQTDGVRPWRWLKLTDEGKSWRRGPTEGRVRK